MASKETTTSTQDGEKAKRPARKPNPFRNVVERAMDEHAIKIDLGLAKPTDDVSVLVRDKESGDIFAVTVKRMTKK